MTQEYLVGEFSVRLEMLQAASSAAEGAAVGKLRREVEEHPPGWLGPAMVRALAIADGLCWDSLSCGDLTAFDRQARAGAELRDFGVCAGLLVEEES